MKNISETKKVIDLFIPGTHDSATSGVDIPFVTTQSKDIMGQLNDGIRFVDIRINRVNINGTSGIVLTHGPVPLFKEFWKDAFDPVKKFLHKNPSEFVVISIKEDELTATGRISDKDVALILRYGIFVSTKTALEELTVKDCRGKMIFLNRINKEGYAWGGDKMRLGDDYELPLMYREQVIVPGIKERTQRVCCPIPDPSWDNPFRTKTQCKEVVIIPEVEERTQRVPSHVGFEWKTKKVDNFMKSKRTSGKLNICFLSATNAEGGPEGAISMALEPNGVSRNAKIQNNWFANHSEIFLNDGRGGCIVPMDFPNRNVIKRIINLNMKSTRITSSTWARRFFNAFVLRKNNPRRKKKKKIYWL